MFRVSCYFSSVAELPANYTDDQLASYAVNDIVLPFMWYWCLKLKSCFNFCVCLYFFHGSLYCEKCNWCTCVLIVPRHHQLVFWYHYCSIFVVIDRFRQPISSDGLQCVQQSRIAEKTRRNAVWLITLFGQWRANRNKLCSTIGFIAFAIDSLTVASWSTNIHLTRSSTSVQI